uniref:Interleukin-12 receptor subunit beta-2 n=1 Tax=Fundulus heteroclitus TaxID=8078 RepID=A0A146XXN1_FUNHE
MATPTTWWLLPVLLVTSPCCCCSSPGPPAPPFNLKCYRPCDSKGCLDIKCEWEPKPHPDIATNYTLYWKPENQEDEQVTSSSSSDGFIRRENFESHGVLRVWVQARNEFGSVESQEFVFHTHNITKPAPPTFTSSHHDPLEIYWETICGGLQLSVGPCNVRYHTEDDQHWIEDEDHFSGSYEIREPQPNAVYEFQVRCQCDPSLMSDWSASYRIRSAEAAPVGEVDAWWDCGLQLPTLDCFLNWKNLSLSQARGHILGYEVTVFYSNGTVQLMNVSADEPSSFFFYEDGKWRLTSSLKDVSSVSLSAYNALGATKASPLPMPTPGKQENAPTIYLEMTEENLTVSWNQPAEFYDGVKQYVVQYRECLPGNGFDWIRVDKNQTRAFFKGAFKKYTSYQVSLFVVSNLNKVSQVATARGYSAQRVPSKVPSFKASHISGTKVTLSWEPFPCSNQSGIILYYQIGVNTQKVYNVNATPDHGSMTYKLDLSPGQEYTIWIRAVTVAGPGEKATTTFKINHHEGYEYLIPIVLILLLVIVTCSFGWVVCVFQRGNKMGPLVPQCLYNKVPDPSNSRIFKQMKDQINEPLTWICGPLYEPYPKISVLEVVEIVPKVFDSDKIKKETGCFQMECQDDQKADPVTEKVNRTDSRNGRKEYSKMVDSDEEKNDSWSSSEEEQSTSGYEKHFMPSASEIMVE